MSFTNLQARMRESVQSGGRSAPEKWEFTLEAHAAEQLPEGIHSVELHWRRPGSKRKHGATSPADATAVGSNRTANWNGECLHQPVTIYRKTSSAPISKHFQLRLVGQGSEGQKLIVGKALVDLSKYCTDPAPRYAGRSVFLQLKPAGVVNVSIHAEKAVSNSLDLQSSQMSMISDISSVGYELDDSLRLGDFSHTEASPGRLVPTQTMGRRRASPGPCSPAAAHTPFSETSNPVESCTPQASRGAACKLTDEPEEATGGLERVTSLSREETDFYLGALGSSDAESEPSNSRGRFRRSLKWLVQPRNTKPAKPVQPNSPDSVLEPPLDAALVVAQAGPAPCTVDLSQVEQQDDPAYLRRKLRQLLEDRNEMAYRNWGLEATNCILHAELETAQAKLKQANDQLGSAKAREKSLQRQMLELELKFSAARALVADDRPQHGTGYGIADLQDQLVKYKTQVAQAEFELLEMRQELRISRRNTRESHSSISSPVCDLSISSVPEDLPEDLSLDSIQSISHAIDRALDQTSRGQPIPTLS